MNRFMSSYEQVLRRIFQKRNCIMYDPSGGAAWPPCCSQCACEEEARRATAPKPIELSVKNDASV